MERCFVDKKLRESSDAAIFRQITNIDYPTILGFITFYWMIKTGSWLASLLESYYIDFTIKNSRDTGFFNFLGILLAYLLYIGVMHAYRKQYKRLSQKSSEDTK